MLKLYPLKDLSLETFKKLFTLYYAELGCDDDCGHLIDEYVVADYKAGLLSVDLLDDGDDTAGFVIYQIDGIENDWNKRESWGDIREIYLAPPYRGKGYGKFMLYAAEMKLRERGAKQIYALPSDGACEFFRACGYTDSGDTDAELDCPFYTKSSDGAHGCCK